ncbi:MAG TPA: hypothetical protein PKM73_02970 [Verrucomicrobiota bacterium]|nr:hypothetical protein [Verrucomicrobiota bacterium]HNU50743.1 hypothetical protein [Verrucomicrobiota bacterium]
MDSCTSSHLDAPADFGGKVYGLQAGHLHKFDLQRPFRPWLRGIAWQLVRAELQRFAREQVNRSRLEQLQLAELLAETTQPAPPEEATFLEECLAETPPHLENQNDEPPTHPHDAGRHAGPGFNHGLAAGPGPTSPRAFDRTAT